MASTLPVEALVADRAGGGTALLRRAEIPATQRTRCTISADATTAATSSAKP
ncbi:hypothetical protein [Amnibacterium sp.]|uniref:hypothetical protein n=1 Tax=Amnibacterium sp. TaxID=1872496 RepID=UPI003F7B8071